MATYFLPQIYLGVGQQGKDILDIVNRYFEDNKSLYGSRNKMVTELILFAIEHNARQTKRQNPNTLHKEV